MMKILSHIAEEVAGLKGGGEWEGRMGRMSGNWRVRHLVILEGVMCGRVQFSDTPK